MTAAATGTALECLEFTFYDAVFVQRFCQSCFFRQGSRPPASVLEMTTSSIGLAAGTQAAMAKRYKFTRVIDKTASLMGKTFAPRPVHYIPSGRVLCCMKRRAG